MAYKTLDDLDVRGKRVVVRADLNVPVKDGKVSDATRMQRFAPTVKTLIDKGASVIILSHFDRPKGKVVPEMSLAKIAPALEQLIGKKITFVPTDWQNNDPVAVQPGDVVLMENTRFHPGEEKNDPAFSQLLAQLGDVYVDDAFSCAHRAHCSTEGIAHLLPSAVGPSMQAELQALETVLGNPQRPVMAIVGGAKISSKIELLGTLVHKVQRLAIGGAMANTFLAAQGHEVGQKSLVERDMLDMARSILGKAQLAGCEILLPLDVVAAVDFQAHAPHTVCNISSIDKDAMVLDIGPATVMMLEKALQDSKTLLWNGPFGAFELKPFDAGTNAVARKAAELVAKGALIAVAGGGDTVSALAQAGVIDELTYVSTAGGAFLEWIEGKTLPGVEVLKKERASLRA